MSLRRLLALCVVLCVSCPGAARADVIEPLRGECPPGLGRGIRDRREVCVPAPCIGASDCAEGSTCTEVRECIADEEVTTGGRTIRGEAVVGLCGEDDACERGACRPRRQCEPSVSTASFDPSTHAWTGVSYQAQAPTADPAQAPASSSGCACSAGAPRSTGALAGLLAFVALAAARLRASRRRERRR